MRAKNAQELTRIRPTAHEAAERVNLARYLSGDGMPKGWFALRECAVALMEDRARLLDLLRMVADEPNIDKARALADNEWRTPNVGHERRLEACEARWKASARWKG